jgi:hypothetical protein
MHFRGAPAALPPPDLNSGILFEDEEKGLLSAGLDVWRDRSRLKNDWSREIASALSDCEVICLIWTANSMTELSDNQKPNPWYRFYM